MKKVKIFLFSDALGYEIAERYRFMTDRLPFRYPVETQLGYSSTAVPTILCGEPPTVHRHFSFFYYDRERKSPFAFFRFLHWFCHPRFLFEHHRVRHRISTFLKKLFGFTGYFSLYRVPFERLPYFDYCEKSDIFAPGGLAPARNLCDMLRESGVRFHISDWRRSDRENLEAATALLQEGEVQFLFIYTAGLDGMLHFHVHEPEFVKERLTEFQALVEQMLAAAETHYEDVSFYLFSDHGMTPLTGTADVKARLEALPYRFGKDFVVCYDSTMVRLWILNPACRPALMESVAGLPGHWLSGEEKKRWRVDFTDSQYGDEIFLLDPGVQVVPSDMGAKPIPGMHGYSPADRHSTAVLLASREPDHVPENIAAFFNLMKRETEDLGQVDRA